MLRAAHITVAGRLTESVTMSRTKNDTLAAETGVAVFDGSAGNPHTSYFNVVAYGWRAELLRGGRKGDHAIVTGHMRQDRWVTREGDARQRYKIIMSAGGILLDPADPGGGRGEPPTPDPADTVPY